MTTLQLLLSIGIPSVLVVLAWIQTNTRLSRVETTMDRGFDRADHRFAKTEEHLNRIDADLRQFYHRTGKLEGRVDALEKALANEPLPSR